MFHVDLRDGNAHRLLCCRNEERRVVPLCTISSHPQKKEEFAVGGRDRYARIYDRRMLQERVLGSWGLVPKCRIAKEKEKQEDTMKWLEQKDGNGFVAPVKKFCPRHLRDVPRRRPIIACLVYSCYGTVVTVCAV